MHVAQVANIAQLQHWRHATSLRHVRSPFISCETRELQLATAPAISSCRALGLMVGRRGSLGTLCTTATAGGLPPRVVAATRRPRAALSANTTCGFRQLVVILLLLRCTYQTGVKLKRGVWFTTSRAGSYREKKKIYWSILFRVGGCTQPPTKYNSVRTFGGERGNNREPRPQTICHEMLWSDVV